LKPHDNICKYVVVLAETFHIGTSLHLLYLLQQNIFWFINANSVHFKEYYVSVQETQASHSSLHIYAYDDFRLYLRDRYNFLKQEHPSYTARSFACKAGFSNPGFYNDVIKGRRKLSPEARKKITSVFGLSGNEVEYFNLLVDYGQAKKENLRQEIYNRIVFRRNRSAFARLNPALSRYYQDYRYPLVYNAVMACDFRGNFEKLSVFIYPSVSSAQLQTIIEDLLKWGLVIISDNNRYLVTQRFIEPPATLREHVRQLNREWIMQAAEALMKLPAEKRHMSTMLLSITPKTCKKVAEKVEKFREEIWKMVEEDTEAPSMIMQLNLQYFPRSRKKEST